MRMIRNNICDVNVFALIQINSQWEIIEKDGLDWFWCEAGKHSFSPSMVSRPIISRNFQIQPNFS